MRRSTVLLSCLALGACNADSFDTDGGPGDASNDAPVAVPDGGPADGHVPTDAHAEAAVRFCTTVDASFCEDFDTPNDASAGVLPSTGGGYTLTFENTQVVSAPMALEVTVLQGASGHAYVTAAPGSAISKAALDFKMRLDGITQNASAPVNFFVFGSAGDSYKFGLDYGPGGWMLASLDNLHTAPVTGTVALDEWLDVDVVVGLSATATGVVTLTITGSTSTATAQLTTLSTVGTTPPTPIELTIGTTDGSQAGMAPTVDYDNLVVTLQ